MGGRSPRIIYQIVYIIFFLSVNSSYNWTAIVKNDAMDQILQAPICRSQYHHPISLILLKICINLHPMVGATIWKNMDYITCMSCLQGLCSCNNAHAVSDYPSLIKGNSMGNRKRRSPSTVKEYKHRSDKIHVKHT